MNPERITPTAEQRRIIGHPLEPLRVVAGAGTGKTTTIVARLVSMVRAGIEPEEALGITFTNKAAEELAERLRTALPDLAADGREVEVTTYHGFALRLLSEFGAVVGVERPLRVIGPGYVRQLLTESIGTMPFAYLDLTALAWRVDEAANLGSQLSGNLAEPVALRAAAPAPPDEVWAARLELGDILERYARTKSGLGVVDYGDLILLAHRLMSEHPQIAQRIRDRYRTVMLDEYQDTDPAQRELLRGLFGEGFSVTAVGDADQTIYEWRGASLENFAGFPQHFTTPTGEPAPTMPLTLNRRSGARILGFANGIRALLHEDEAFMPLEPAQPGGDELHGGWFRTAWEEATWIAGEIVRLHGEEDLAWRDMAILFRKNRQMSLVRDALHDAEVPLEVVSLGGLLSVPEVADIHAWLRILGRPDDSVALARVLFGGAYRLGFADLAPLAAWVRRRDGVRDPDAALGYPLLEAIDRLPEVEGLTKVGELRLQEFRATYRRLLSEAQGITLVELIRRIIDSIDGWLEVEAMPPSAGLSARLNLYRFLDLAEDWSPLTGHPSLDAFLGYLDLLQEERASEELDTARIGSEDAVSLLTVHRAKGLEWNTVFLPSAATGIFPATSQGFDDPLAAPKWLPYELRLDAPHLPDLPSDEKERKDLLRSLHLAQERRTAYVAATRARRRLYVTGAAWYETKRPKQPSELLDLVRGIPGRTLITWADDPGDPPAERRSTHHAPDPLFDEGWRNALRNALADPSWVAAQTEDQETMRTARTQLELMLDGLPSAPDTPTTPEPATSVTGLVTLASCPLRFYWSEIDRLPRRPSEWLRRGTDVHRRIELHHRGVAPLEGFSHDTPALSEKETDRSTNAYDGFARSRFAGATPLAVETPIDFPVADTRIRGRIDAVFAPEPRRWEIVDYKSGSPSTSDAAVVQLQAYAVAAARGAVAGGPPEAMRVTFAYLGHDPVVEVSHEVTPAWLQEAEQRITELARQAAGENFPATPSAACRRCDFVSVCAEGTAWLREDASR